MRGVDAEANPTRWIVLAVVLLLVWNVWGYDLWAPDEPYFGEGAREMIADGKWVVPHVNGQITTDKPPLFFWLIALLSLPLGAVSSLTARLPSILAAMGTLLLTVRLGRRLAGGRLAGPQVGLLAGAMLATTHMFWDKARTAQIDSLLCFLILVALSAFEAFRSGDLPGRRAGLLFWGAAGLAVLAKGPVGLLLPLGVAVATLALARELPRWRSFAPGLGPLLFVTVVGLWMVATSLWGEGYSVWGALREHFVDRAIHGMHHRQPVWYYLQVLPYALLPWSFLLPGAVLLAWRRRHHAEDRFLLVFALFVVLFFTVPTEKRDLYILPALPPLALLMARLVAAVAGLWPASRDGGVVVPSRHWVTLPLAGVGVVMILGGLAAPFAAPRFGAEMIAPAVGLAVVLSAGGFAIVYAAWRGQPMGTAKWAGIAMAAAMLTAVSFVFPALNPTKSGRELALVVRDATVESRARGQPVFGMDLGNVPRAVSFYSDGIYLQEVADLHELMSAVETAGENTYLLADQGHVSSFPPSLQEHMNVLYSTRLSRKDIVFLRFNGGGHAVGEE